MKRSGESVVGHDHGGTITILDRCSIVQSSWADARSLNDAAHDERRFTGRSWWQSSVEAAFRWNSGRMMAAGFHLQGLLCVASEMLQATGWRAVVGCA